MDQSIQLVIDCCIEGKCKQVRFIQQQLAQLHAATTEAADEICKAIRDDEKLPLSHAEVLYLLLLQFIQKLAHSVDFPSEIEREYSIARSENNTVSREAFGVAYIVPQTFNQICSCLAAVAASIAAGNCVVVQLPKTTSTRAAVLQSILEKGLAQGTVAVVDHAVSLNGVPPKWVISLYASPEAVVSGDIPPSQHTLVPSSARSIAIVDRYANMSEAASSIVRARFSFAGQAPLAPDVIYINEFRVKEFCQSITQHSTQYFAHQVDLNGSTTGALLNKERQNRKFHNELSQAGEDVIVSGSMGSVVLVKDPKSPTLKRKITEPTLIIYPVRSIDEAMDLANKEQVPLQALYIFGSPETAKYVGQFTDTDTICVNEIPVELLVGPVTPRGYAVIPGEPYRTEMFSRPKPQYVNFGELTTTLARILDQDDLSRVTRLRLTAQKIDVGVQQRPGHAIGFFEQGLILGGVMKLSGIVVLGAILQKTLWTRLRR